jgi:hypothetical protein
MRYTVLPIILIDYYGLKYKRQFLLVTMSSFHSPQIQSFIAPLSISQQHISTTGSWQAMSTPTLRQLLVSNTTPFRVMLHTWKHQSYNNVSDVTLCWVADTVQRQFIEVHSWKNRIDIINIADYIQTILESKHTEILHLYQHMHPGAVRSSSVAANTGNEGASQSD